MSVFIRADERPADERLDFVREMSARLWVPMDFRAEGTFRGEFRVSGLGPMQVVVIDTVPVTVFRTAAHIAEADPDMLKAFMMCGGGRSVVTQGERQAALGPGEFAFYDTRRPYEVACGVDTDRSVRLLTFMFPPSLLPLPRSGIRDLAAIRIPATQGLGDLTSQFLLQLARNVDNYTPAEAARLSTAALEVLATRLARELAVRDWGTPQARGHALLTTIQAFIRENLGDPRLSPPTVAAAHHISLRTAHQLFHDEGLTVAGWIRAQRLDRCRRDLADPALGARPVAAIGARWGFSSASEFGRAFRAAYGMPPAEYRRSARAAHGPAR
jgi:AraC-like DNA-binding protein